MSIYATICDKCGICFDLDYEYDDILIAKKNEYDGYTQLNFCQACGKQIYDAVQRVLRGVTKND